MATLPIAVQLYSLRDELDKDFEGTLRKVKEMGYDGVEFAGLYNHTPAEIKAMCEEIGLTPISAHVTTDEFRCNGIDVTLDRYKAVGCSYVVIPYLDDKRRPGAPLFEETLELMDKIGEGAAARGMTLLYHNHDFEFKTKIDGKYGLDVMYERISADHLQTELDTCWVNIGGEVPASYIAKYSGRSPVVHLKDFHMTGSLPKHLYALIGIDEDESNEQESTFEFRPVGHGMQDMPAILKASVEAGAKWVVVEQDDPSAGTTPMECATKSIGYLRELNW